MESTGPAAAPPPDDGRLRVLSSRRDLDAPELAPYVTLTDAALRRAADAEHGVFLAESTPVVRRALEAGCVPRSFLVPRRYLETVGELLAAHPDVPVYTGDDEVLTALTGFHLHRGALAAMERPAPRTVESVLEHARRVLVAEDLTDPTNLGAIVRSAVALGWDALLLSPRAADPLYRRAVRVSMGTVFRLPWARAAAWPEDAADGGGGPDGGGGAGATPMAAASPAVPRATPNGVAQLKEAGFAVVALEVTDQAVDLDDALLAPVRHAERLALVVGAEGPGVRPATLALCDAHVKIPMPAGVDSLNVGAAAAVALWELRSRPV